MKSRKKADYVFLSRNSLIFITCIWIAGGIALLIAYLNADPSIKFIFVLFLAALFGTVLIYYIYQYNTLYKFMKCTMNKMFQHTSISEGEQMEFLNKFKLSTEDIDVILEKALSNTQQKSAYELLQKQAQLDAMQNQMNPHFLYNALDSIRGLALEQGAESTADMVESLSTLFRYSISHGNNLQTLEQEISNIDDYMKIQQYRFNNRYNVKKDLSKLEGKMFNYRLPKLSLQPLFENAIFHGFDQSQKDPQLVLSAYTTQSRLIISVKDNGIGMEEDKLIALNEKLANGQAEEVENSLTRKKSGIALVNVNARIKLLFGERYGLVAYSTKGIGTEIQIVLPLMVNQGEG